MADINRCVFTGRMGQDPAVPTVTGDNKRLNFSIAVNGFKNDTTWINATCWNKVADYVSQYASKGSLICLEGNLQTYKTKEGNKGFSINATSVNVYNSLTDAGQNEYDEKLNEYNAYNSSYEAPNQTEPIVNDDDMPF